jgi:hypothetical protein
MLTQRAALTPHRGAAIIAPFRNQKHLLGGSLIMGYFTTAAPQFGPLGWIFFLGQILGAGAGAYLYFMHTERNSARQTFLGQVGIGLLILGGVGVLMGAVRLFNVPTLNQHLWFWLQAVVELGFVGYIVYYSRNVLPNLERSAAPSARSGKPNATRAARPANGGNPAPAVPRPVATTSRRDARRDRKRKSR